MSHIFFVGNFLTFNLVLTVFLMSSIVFKRNVENPFFETLYQKSLIFHTVEVIRFFPSNIDIKGCNKRALGQYFVALEAAAK